MAEETPQNHRFPQDFLKDIFIIPHVFDNPEREEHLRFINFELKHDLFRDAYDKISTIEFNNLKEDEDWFRLRQIVECSKSDEDSYLETIYRDRFLKKEIQNKMLRCEKWTLNINDKRDVTYKLRFYQSELDGYFSIIYPPTTRKYMQHYYYNIKRKTQKMQKKMLK